MATWTTRSILALGAAIFSVACVARPEEEVGGSRAATTSCSVYLSDGVELSPNGGCFVKTPQDTNWFHEGETLFTYANGESPDARENGGSYTLMFSEPGSYRLEAFIPAGADRTERAPYSITHGGGKSYLRANQAAASGGWMDLGVYGFEASTAYALNLSDAPAEAASAKKRIIFDRVRATKIRDGLGFDCMSDLQTEATCNAHGDKCDWKAALGRCMPGGTSDASAACLIHAESASCESKAGCTPAVCDDGGSVCMAAGEAPGSLCMRDRTTCPVIGDAPAVLDDSGACFSRVAPVEEHPNEHYRSTQPETYGPKWRDIAFGNRGGAQAMRSMVFLDDRKDTKFRSYARFSLRFARGGRYKIEAYMPDVRDAVAAGSLPLPVESARYDVHTIRPVQGDVYEDSGNIAQRERATGQWKSLGAYDWQYDYCFSEGGDQWVEVGDYQHKNAPQGDRSILVDAVRITRVGECN